MLRALAAKFLFVTITAHAAAFQRFQFSEPLQPPRAHQVMVHRGATTRAPENSRAALQLCIDDTFEWAEIDLRLTKDGHHILNHDSTLLGKNIADHDLAELQQLDI